MNKLLKYSALGLGGLIGLVLIIIAIVTATFNPNDYKQKIIDLVKEKKQRTLHIDGDIKLSFWPKIGADLGKISLSEFQSERIFASINGVKVSLALFPLLKKQLVVDTIYVEGANANIIKHKDGSNNFDDLISKDEQSQDIKFDIDGINVSQSAINYSDEITDAKYNITNLNLKSGHIALAKPVDLSADFSIASNKPDIAAITTLKGNFLVDTKTNHFVAKDLITSIKGDLLGGKSVDIIVSGNVDAKPDTKEFLIDKLKLVGSGQFNDAKLSIDLNIPEVAAQKVEFESKKATLSLIQEKAGNLFKANLELADIKGSPKALQSSGITGNISSTQGKRSINGKFSSPLIGNLENLIFDLPKLTGNLDIKDPSLPNGGMQGNFNFAAHTDIKNELANSTFNLSIEDTRLLGDFSVVGFKKPNIKFNISADNLNLNKLLTKPSQPQKNNDNPTDLSSLKNILIEGKLSIDNILYDKYHVSGLKVSIKDDGEKLMLSGINVKMDDSKINGNFAISHFAKPLYTFDLDIDHLDVDKYVATGTVDKKTSDKPLDLSSLKALNADGVLRIGNLKYGKTNASNIVINLKADGQKLNLNPLSAKIDDSQIKGRFAISQFNNPAYNFDVTIDKLDADKYITKNDPNNKSSVDSPIDLSPLKKLNASGEAKIGWLKLANIKTENVNLGLKSEGGIATLSPFSADLYHGNMSGILKVDARTTPSISLKQSMKDVSVGQLMVDALHNDMLEGKGTVNVDITTTGNNVGALKKSLAGSASLSLVDGALKGIDIAGSIRELKSKVNFLKPKDNVSADSKKKTDFSELTATFNIKNGIAHNEDLAMKAPILRLAKGDSRGDIDIGNEKISYLAKPTVVKSLKGQGGAELNDLSGITIPIKISGTFSDPKYGMDFAAIGTALAKSSLIDKVGGVKGSAIKDLIGVGKKNPNDIATPSTSANGGTASTSADAPKSTEEKVKEKAENKLKKILKF